jgi:hypothetical protein
MLAPHWDLPTSRRGTISLNAEETNAIFSPEDSQQFIIVKNERVKRMNAPSFGRESDPNVRPRRPQLLPGFSDD